MAPKLLDAEYQLSYYGAYHRNKINIFIHIICVPIIQWTSQVWLSQLPVPSFFPHTAHVLNTYMIYQFNWSWIISALHIVYYAVLEPGAAIVYAPLLGLSILTATSFAQSRPNASIEALVLHVAVWIAQFVGHGKFEGRAPTLLDNLIAAVVLAPFFVHVEMMFAVGYNPTLSKKIEERVDKERARLAIVEAENKKKTL